MIMPQSLAKVLIHIVFSTKNRATFLKNQKVREALFAYGAGTLQELDCPAVVIGGVEDHIHILCLLARTITIAKLVETIKTSTSKWIKTQGPNYRGFYWQGGYGAFSVSESQKAKVREYIQNQEEHHRIVTFQDEFRRLCAKHGIQIDERYVWD
jgi:REP element-mobilizing transposase RayT